MAGGSESLVNATLKLGRANVDGRFTYETDNLGRVVRASAQPDAVDAAPPRDARAQRTMEGKLPGDYAGHIFARLFQDPGGST